MVRRALLLGIVGLLLAIGSTANAVTIDDFDVGQTGSYISTGTSDPISMDQTGLSTLHVIGGARYRDLDQTAGSGTFASSAVITVGSQTVLSWGNDENVESILTVEYGHTADLNVNLSADNAFYFIAKTDATTHHMDIDMTVKVGGVEYSSSPTLTIATADTYTSVSIPFSSFAGVMDWSDVDMIRLTLSTDDPNTDGSIDLFTTTNPGDEIPEPFTMGLLGMGLAGLGGYIRRRRA